MTYLPGSSPQWRRVRRNGGKPSGVVVIHTAENAYNRTATPDRAAETVAAWIARRDPAREGYGSYHALVDSDSIVRLVPWASEAWHDTATNNHSVGISAAVRTTDWARMTPARRTAIVANMAAAAREYAAWLERTHGITIPARMITRDQALNRVPGFVAHGTMDPGRRSDPGKDFPWAQFLALYAGEDDDMSLFTAKHAEWLEAIGRRAGYLDANVSHVLARAAATQAEVTALGSAMDHLARALADREGIDADDLVARIHAAVDPIPGRTTAEVRKALEDAVVDVDVTVRGGTPEG